MIGQSKDSSPRYGPGGPYRVLVTILPDRSSPGLSQTTSLFTLYLSPTSFNDPVGIGLPKWINVTNSVLSVRSRWKWSQSRFEEDLFDPWTKCPSLQCGRITFDFSSARRGSFYTLPPGPSSLLWGWRSSSLLNSHTSLVSPLSGFRRWSWGPQVTGGLGGTSTREEFIREQKVEGKDLKRLFFSSLKSSLKWPVKISINLRVYTGRLF